MTLNQKDSSQEPIQLTVFWKGFIGFEKAAIEVDNIEGGTLTIIDHSGGKAEVWEAVKKFFPRVPVIPVQENVNEFGIFF